MNLSQALKTKNRLAGEIVKLQQIFQRENSKRSDNPSKVDAESVWLKILNVSTDLGELKAKIAVANVPIYPKIERIAELKSQICFIQQLPKREGEEISFVGRDQEKLVYTWTAFINEESADKIVEGIQLKINETQDLIDIFNNTTEI